MNDEGEDNKMRREDLTRRQWLLRLGETVALVGFRGVVDEAFAKPNSLLGSADPSLAGLPPGLYEPSNDHLSHALTNDAPFHPIPPGSETDYVPPGTGPFQPQFFSPAEYQIVRRIVELMLGESANPASAPDSKQASNASIVDEVAEWIDFTVFNAAEVREAALKLAPQHRILAVHFFGARAVGETETSDPQKVYRQGLPWLAEESERRFNNSFLSLNEEQQIAVLKLISDDRSDKTNENSGTRIFQLIKSEVIRGFYTSKVGLKELDYKGNSFYVESPGCQHTQHNSNQAPGEG